MLVYSQCRQGAAQRMGCVAFLRLDLIEINQSLALREGFARPQGRTRTVRVLTL
jgi:hypothetical protein